MKLVVNQTEKIVDLTNPTIAAFVSTANLPIKAIVIAVNGDVIPKSAWDDTSLKDGDEVEIVRAVSGGDHDPLVIAGETFSSRLFLGTGKYPDNASMAASLAESGTEMVTVAIRYMNLEDVGSESLLDHIDLTRYKLL